MFLQHVTITAQKAEKYVVDFERQFSPTKTAHTAKTS